MAASALDPLWIHVWTASLVFVRIGCVLMLAPGWGEAFVPVNVRLAVAVLVCIAVAPVVGPIPTPADAGEASSTILREALTGLMLGGAARLLMAAVHIGGQAAALHGGLALAQQFDPNAGESGAMIGAFLSMLAVALVMAGGLHHLMLRAAVDSYAGFPLGAGVPASDAAMWMVHSAAQAFELGIRIASPVIAFSLVFNIALGIANRLIPQIQIFFVALPSAVWLALAALALGMAGGLHAWLRALEDQALMRIPV